MNTTRPTLIAVTLFAPAASPEFPAVQKLRDDLLGRLCLLGVDKSDLLSDGSICEGIGPDWILIFEVLDTARSVEAIKEGLSSAGMAPNDYEIAVLPPAVTHFAASYRPRDSHVHGRTLPELMFAMEAGHTAEENQKSEARYHENIRRFDAIQVSISMEMHRTLAALREQLSKEPSLWSGDWKEPSNWILRLFESWLQTRRAKIYKSIRRCAESLRATPLPADLKPALENFLAAPWGSFHEQRAAYQKLAAEFARVIPK